MIKVIMGNNLKRSTVIVDPNTTLKQALTDNEIDYSAGTMHLDGATLEPGALNKTFAEFGYTGQDGRDTCYLLNVVKADNAA